MVSTDAPSLTDEITTARIVIRSFQPADAEALYQTVAASREHIARWLEWTDQHTSAEASRDVIEFTFGVFARETGALLGGLGLHPHHWDVPSFEIGYWLAASAEGHGYITEAATALVNYALRELGALRIEIRCNALNVRSAAVARRLGFAQEALLRHEQRTADGTLRDTLIFARVV
jgi:RimJ/RimL family protein N-acetyltransferase